MLEERCYVIGSMYNTRIGGRAVIKMAGGILYDINQRKLGTYERHGNVIIVFCRGELTTNTSCTLVEMSYSWCGRIEKLKNENKSLQESKDLEIKKLKAKLESESFKDLEIKRLKASILGLENDFITKKAILLHKFLEAATKRILQAKQNRASRGLNHERIKELERIQESKDLEIKKLKEQLGDLKEINNARSEEIESLLVDLRQNVVRELESRPQGSTEWWNGQYRDQIKILLNRITELESRPQGSTEWWNGQYRDQIKILLNRITELESRLMKTS